MIFPTVPMTWNKNGKEEVEYFSKYDESVTSETAQEEMCNLSGSRRKRSDSCVLMLIDIDLCLSVHCEDILFHGCTCHFQLLSHSNAVFEWLHIIDCAICILGGQHFSFI